ncbi:hypothetical protein HDU93_001589, partial [Gonapodya sp. JEL0774]
MWAEIDGKKTEWKWDGLRAATGLVWVVAARVVAESDPTPQPHLTHLTPKTTSLIDSSALLFFRTQLLAFRPWHWTCDGVLTPPSTPARGTGAASFFSSVPDQPSLDKDLHARCLSVVEDWVIGFLQRCGTAVWRARQVEEDNAGGGAPSAATASSSTSGDHHPTRSTRFSSSSHRASSPTTATTTSPVPATRLPPSDPPFTSLLLLLHLLFRGRPDSSSALRFWRTPACVGFLNHARDTTSATARAAVFLAIVGVAEGGRCAGEAFRYLEGAGGGRGFGGAGGIAGYGTGMGQQHHLCSWKALAAGVEYSTRVAVQSASAGPTATSTTTTPTTESAILTAFLHLLRTVVSYHTPARLALSGLHPHPHPHQRYAMLDLCVALAVAPVPAGVKAAAVGAVGGMCEGRDGAAEWVWKVVEEAGVVVQVRQEGGAGGGGGVPSAPPAPATPPGAQADLELESSTGRYPVTTALVELFATLVRTTVNGSGVGGVYETLGAGKRSPGVRPYVEWVVGGVGGEAATRYYADPAEKYRLVYAYVRFVEACLDTFDLGDVAAHRSARPIGATPHSPPPPPYPAVPAVHDPALAALQSAIHHPGFTVMLAILSGHKLVDDLCAVIAAEPVPGLVGVEAVDAGTAAGVPPDFKPAVIRCMRILTRVAELERPFLDTVVPAVRDAVAARAAATGGGGQGA